jgi:signal transduction histidine kinase
MLAAFSYLSIGALFMMAVLVAAQYIVIRHRAYKYLLLYMCCTVVIILSQNNLNREFGTYSLLYNISFSTLPVLSFILCFLFLIHLLDLRTGRPRLFKAVQWILYGLSFYLVIDLLIFAVFGLYDLHIYGYHYMRFLLAAISTVLCLLVLKDGSREAAYFTTGTLLFILCGVVTTLLQYEYYRSDNKVESLLDAPMFYYRSGVIVHAFFLILGISHRTKKLGVQTLLLQNRLDRETLQKELEKQKAIEQTRASIAGDLHDDLGATLSSIHIYSKLAREKLNTDPAQMNNILEKINETSQSMMSNMSDMVWAIKPENDALESLSFRIKNIAREILEPKEIHYTVQVHSGEEKISMEARRNIFLIIKEALNNIVKYSEAKNVSVRMEIEGSSMKLMIDDDGKGFDVASASSDALSKGGNGIANMKHRTEQLGGVFSITSQKNQGTQIKAEFDIEKINY